MDAGTLAQVMGHALPMSRYEALAPAFNRAMVAAGCTTLNRAAMWCAQLGHESGGLQWMEEIADGSAYEWRSDLGNNQPGDGRRFKGHGPIQITGRANHTAVSKWAYSKGLTSDPNLFVTNPSALGNDEYGFIGPVWYWTVARPSINAHCDNGDIVTVTKLINGGTNGLQDRISRFNRAKALGDRILPSTKEKDMEKVLPFSRELIKQETYYYCGPASTQTVLQSALGRYIPESTLAVELSTHVGGTDWIGQFPRVLNKYVPSAKYAIASMPNDPPTQSQRDALWNNVVSSINAGHGVIANIVAPPSNYPRGIWGSANPSYGGGTIYHYVAIMGYAIRNGQKGFFIADSGFYRYEYWVSFNQMATLIPPKGYAYATKEPVDWEDEELAKALDTVYESLLNPNYKQPLKQFILNADAHSYTAKENTEELRKDVEELTKLVKSLANEVQALREEVSLLTKKEQ